ncbi:MAG: hypothetical protein SVK08_10355, partial [Halobacteriota archaeon]|nr:hypothetical protein [Halobacteriota archaeon]
LIQETLMPNLLENLGLTLNRFRSNMLRLRSSLLDMELPGRIGQLLCQLIERDDVEPDEEYESDFKTFMEELLDNWNKKDYLSVLCLVLFGLKENQLAMNASEYADIEGHGKDTEFMLFVKTLILEESALIESRSNRQYLRQAIQNAERLVELNPNSARYYHLLGRCMAQDSKISKDFNDNVGKAIKLFEQGRKLTQLETEFEKYEHLLYFIFSNNLAFCYLLLYEREPKEQYLEKCDDNLGVLSKLPQAHWPPNFFDTQAKRLIIEARMVLDSKTRRRLLKKARDLITYLPATECKYYVPRWLSKSISDRLGEIDELLGGLE